MTVAAMPLLEVKQLSTHFSRPDGLLRAVNEVSFHIDARETVALVGESGCGKSTLGRTILRLQEPTSGKVVFDGRELTGLSARGLLPFRRQMQMIFQDPFASLNPRKTVGEILDGPLSVHEGSLNPEARARKINALLDSVGLPRQCISRYPHEFSGGQRQRIGIARALLLRPKLVVCDEPVSALDLSVQAQILNLLSEMKESFDLSYLFISHDLSVVRYIADRVMVMYLGQIVESADRESLWDSPRHPYTQALLDAVPSRANKRRAAPIVGDLPSPMARAVGCAFHPRCPRARDLCRVQSPALGPISSGHLVACHFPIQAHQGLPDLMASE